MPGLSGIRTTSDEECWSDRRLLIPQSRTHQQRWQASSARVALGDRGLDGLVALLTDDAWFTMPPVPLQYQGPLAIASFLRHWSASRRTRRLRLVPTHANTEPAFGLYLHDAHAPVAHAAGLIVLTLHGDRIAALTCFYDTSVLPRFGLPRTLPD
jgi:RNA polymerase sigma-70 factor (ECF subfamily)